MTMVKCLFNETSVIICDKSLNFFLRKIYIFRARLLLWLYYGCKAITVLSFLSYNDSRFVSDLYCYHVVSFNLNKVKNELLKTT